jgi:hypothetical protein
MNVQEIIKKIDFSAINTRNNFIAEASMWTKEQRPTVTLNRPLMAALQFIEEMERQNITMVDVLKSNQRQFKEIFGLIQNAQTMKGEVM